MESEEFAEESEVKIRGIKWTSINTTWIISSPILCLTTC